MLFYFFCTIICWSLRETPSNCWCDCRDHRCLVSSGMEMCPVLRNTILLWLAHEVCSGKCLQLANVGSSPGEAQDNQEGWTIPGASSHLRHKTAEAASVVYSSLLYSLSQELSGTSVSAQISRIPCGPLAYISFLPVGLTTQATSSF